MDQQAGDRMSVLAEIRRNPQGTTDNGKNNNVQDHPGSKEYVVDGQSVLYRPWFPPCNQARPRTCDAM